MLTVNATIPKPFAPLLSSGQKIIIESSGRSTGKTTTNETIAIIMMLSNRNNNVWYCRAETNDLRKTIFASFWATVQNLGLERYFKTSINPLEITCISSGAVCYFSAINGKTAEDLNATKGFTPQGRTIAFFILDEANEAKSPNHIIAAETTAAKFLLPNAKIIYAYNPPPVKTHWAHRFFQAKIDNGAAKIYTTWHDIAKLLTPATIASIKDMQTNDARHYAYWYLGQCVSMQGLVLYTFSRDKNLVSLEWLQRQAAQMIMPMYIIYGVDSGIVKDATAVCAWAIMPNGFLLKLSTYEKFPKDTPIPNSQQAADIKQWYLDFYAMFRRLGIMLPGAASEVWVFDSAVVTQDLMFEWQNLTGFYVKAVENKSIDRDIKRLQNGYFTQMFKVLDIPENQASLTEDENFVYNENNEIPDGQSDHTIDADKYATAHYYYAKMLED